MNVVDPWIQRVLVPLGLLPFVIFNGRVSRMKARYGKSLSGSRTVFKPLSALNPSQIEVFIDYILNALSQPPRLSRISGEGEGLQLLLVVSLDGILSKLLRQLLDVSPTQLVVLRLWVLSFHVRNIAHCAIGIFAVPKIVETDQLAFEKVLRRSSVLILRRGRIEHQGINKLIWLRQGRVTWSG